MTVAIMEESWLVQRLQPPRPPHTLLGADNPFAFGGGLRNGGLSDEAMDLLRGIFSFDYMGAAEFEFGAVPKALTRIVKDVESYNAFTFDLPLRGVAKDFRDKTEGEPEGSATIYVICHEGHATEVRQRIKGWAAKPYERLKEMTHLSVVLRPVPNATWTPDVCGWLELDNGFFFFTGEAMWRSTADLFSIAAPSVSEDRRTEGER